MTEKALVIIPTYNEKENVRSVIERVLATDARLEILIVDDNSPDKTGDIVDAESRVNSRVHLMRRPGKMGLGTAYSDGFAGRSSATTSTSSRWMPISRTIRHICRSFSKRRRRRISCWARAISMATSRSSTGRCAG